MVLSMMLVFAAALMFLPQFAYSSSSLGQVHAPILINGNNGFTADNGVTGGSGTSSDPYLIDNWLISTTGSGIEIDNTNVFFVMTNISIQGMGRPATAIVFSNVTNGKLTNSIMQGFFEGVSSVSSSQITLSEDSYVDVYQAVSLQTSSNVLIEKNTQAASPGFTITALNTNNLSIVDNTLNGEMSLGHSASFSIRGNQIHGFGGGIHVDNSHDFSISGNQVQGAWGPPGRNCCRAIAISVSQSGGFEISGNSITGSPNAIWLQTVIDATVQNNVISNSPGLTGFDAHNLAVSNNVFENSSIGLSGSNISITGNKLHGRLGIEVGSSDGVEISDNEVSDSPLFGIRVAISNAHMGLVIQGNTILRNAVGILVQSSRGLDILNNQVSSNGIGISVESSYPNVESGNITIAQNELSSNGRGLILNSTFGILTYHNNLYSNTVQAADYNGISNAWDSGYPIGGNFWSDYTGADNCSGPNQNVCFGPDGIGDTPYVFNYNQDNYPLMQPYSKVRA
jgi:parallel beta-helix repeat protein